MTEPRYTLNLTPKPAWWRKPLAVLAAGSFMIAVAVTVRLVPIGYTAAFLLGCFWMCLLHRIYYGHWPDYR